MKVIKKIKVEIQEEKKKRTYKHSVEVKIGAMAQERMKELAEAISKVLAEFGLLEEQGEDEE